MGATRRPSVGDTTADVAFIGDHQPPDTTYFWAETRLFLELAIPTCLLGFAFTLSPLLTASYVGLKFGPVFLSAFTLGNLTGNLCTFSLLAGLFSASDTLSPQAYGIGNYKEVGLIAMRGFFASVVLILPINVLLVMFMEDILLAVGQDPGAAFHATQWYQIFVWALPFFVAYDALWKFLSAQHVMRPLIYVSLFCCVVVLPIALHLCTEYYGFLGSAMAYVCFQSSQCILLILYVVVFQPHTEGTWPGLGCWRDALKYRPMIEYISLGAGGILSQSEWIYWEALSLLVGNLGVIPLSAHTIPNQVIFVSCQFPFSFGTALAIRMGHVLSKSVAHAKQLAAVTTSLSTLLFLITTIVVFMVPDWIFAMFTSNEDVIVMGKSIWLKVALINLNISLFGLLWGVATGLGMQWTLGAINFGILWIFGVPVTYYYALVRGGGLASVWTWINVLYTCMNVSLILIFFFMDWKKVQAKIREREEVETSKDLETQRGRPDKLADREAEALLNDKSAVNHYGVTT